MPNRSKEMNWDCTAMKTLKLMNVGNGLSMPSNASTILAHLIGTTPIMESSLGNLQEMNRFLGPERLFPVACDANMNKIYRV